MLYCVSVLAFKQKKRGRGDIEAPARSSKAETKRDMNARRPPAIAKLSLRISIYPLPSCPCIISQRWEHARDASFLLVRRSHMHSRIVHSAPV